MISLLCIYWVVKLEIEVVVDHRTTIPMHRNNVKRSMSCKKFFCPVIGTVRPNSSAETHCI